MNNIGSDLFIITKNINDEPYIIQCKYIQDLIDDWNNDRKICPQDGAKVYFAMWNYKTFNPYNYSNFRDLMKILEDMTK